jgi:hypothetical protein
MADQYLTTLHGVEYPDGTVTTCYVLASREDDCATAVEVRRAVELQRDGVPFYVFDGHSTPEDFGTFFGPDFPPINA